MFTLFAYGISLGQSSLESDLSATLRRPRRVKSETTSVPQSERLSGTSTSQPRPH